MNTYNIIATSAFGLEAIVKREIQKLGYENLQVSDGKVELTGTMADIAKLNINLKCADRVFIKLGEFKAVTFTELFDKTFEINWDEILPADANFIVAGKSIKSKLFSIRDCQSIVEKSIIEKLKLKHKISWFEKNGARYNLEVALLKDIATITLDTSGIGLHKRGYRSGTGLAPIRETLAAALVELSFWKPERQLLDCFCGSGTIAIEAARIARNIAPGIDRTFDFINWDTEFKNIHKEERSKAMDKIDYDVELNILATDISGSVIEKAILNAENAGVREDIDFVTRDFRNVILPENYGVLITNPPYGERMGERLESEQMYKELGEKFNKLETWSEYIITDCETFEDLYNKKADRKRKLYNGRIKVDFYQYYGQKPERK